MPLDQVERKGRILIADDEPFQLLFIEKALQRLGHEVKVAQTATHALEILRQERFDILLTDMVMPDLDGVNLVRKVREFDPRTSIFLVTALKSQSNLTEAVTAGADGYILKPVEIELLRWTIQRELAVRDLQRRLSETQK